MSDTENQTEKDLSDIQNDPDTESHIAAQPYDIPLDELLSGESSTLTPEEIKKLKKTGLWGLGILLVVILLSFYACQPRQGSMAFGICSTFLELNTPYPHTLNYTALEGSRTSIRIYFTSTDPFGQYRQEMLECKFGPDDKTGMKLTEVLRNRRPMDQKIVREFNVTLPTIMASDPYIVMPPEWKNPLVKD